ncbi:hypothetical protein HUN59_04635 [Curtobacterium sp. Csp2]|uniref:hypothetical protein n=1 Tax=Curtobacterium sp. Csp2 TaxID=2495430 RepID=UPI00158003A6|nr:hypothetical protein [Curtobacterium sp. Csp2]QKS15598.1 hypothetical protein HUN59_04635 [Curtobacterium sp. Csp2]
MSGGDGAYNAGVRIEGLNRTIRALSKAGADAQDMRDLMHEIGMLVVSAAQPPSRSGRLQSTIRAGRGKTKAVVRMGGARAPYGGVIEYGDPARNISKAGTLEDALTREQGPAVAKLDQGIGAILRKNDLT